MINNISFTIIAGQKQSEETNINLQGPKTINSIITTSNLTLDASSNLFMKFKVKRDGAYYYVYNDGDDSQLQIVKDKVILFNGQTDLRGEQSVIFELTVIQSNDVKFEITFNSFL